MVRESGHWGQSCLLFVQEGTLDLGNGPLCFLCSVPGDTVQTATTFENRVDIHHTDVAFRHIENSRNLLFGLLVFRSVQAWQDKLVSDPKIINVRLIVFVRFGDIEMQLADAEFLRQNLEHFFSQTAKRKVLKIVKYSEGDIYIKKEARRPLILSYCFLFLMEHNLSMYLQKTKTLRMSFYPAY